MPDKTYLQRHVYGNIQGQLKVYMYKSPMASSDVGCGVFDGVGVDCGVVDCGVVDCDAIDCDIVDCGNVDSGVVACGIFFLLCCC